MGEGFAIGYELDGERHLFRLEAPSVTIGRSAGCELEIRHPSISRRHARLFRDGAAWRVEDLGSLNGTYVNEPGRIGVPLAPGDRIVLDKLELTFLREGAPAPVPEPVVQHTLFRSAVDFAALAAAAEEPHAAAEAPTGEEMPTMPFQVAPGRLERVVSLMSASSQAILDSATLDEAVGKILPQLFEHLPVERAAVLIADADGELQLRYCRGRDERGEDAETIRVSRSIRDRVMDDRVAVLITDAQADQRFLDRASIMELDIRSAMAAPLWREEGIAGILYVDTPRQPRLFDGFDLDLLSSVGNYLATAIERFRLQRSLIEQGVMQRRLERYHSPAVIERIRSEGGEQRLAAEERDVTVLFADMVGFTTLCEQLEPLEIASFLESYFSELVDVVFAHGGTVDKFIGDCLMAVFGAPLPADDHAARAVDSAIAMRRRVRALKRDDVDFRVGIHSGPVVAGDFGSQKRREYTVLGSTVNIAARLESSVAAPGQIVISEATAGRLTPATKLSHHGEHTLKGLAAPVRCYEVVER